MAYRLVLGEYYPATSPSLSEPFLIGDFGLEAIRPHDHLQPCGAKLGREVDLRE